MHPKKLLLTVLTLLSVVLYCDRQPASSKTGQKFEPTWESLEKSRVPDWFRDAKFGIFIHWGVYSVPGFGNEWYPRNMYIQGQPEFEFHRKKYGDQSKFGYKDLIPLFKAEKWNPDEWAELFKKSGAKYVVPVAEHHDGFSMYASKINKWNAAEMGPKRDVVGELAKAVRKQGLVFGMSFHRAEHWWFLNGGRKFDSDVNDPNYADFYGPARPQNTQPDTAFLDSWLLRCKELVENYRPQLFYFDWWVEQPVFKPYWRKFAAYYYNRALDWKRGVVLNYKNEAFPEKTAVLDVERGKLDRIRQRPWQTDTSVGKKSWGFIHDEDFKTPDAVIFDLIDIVSKNGNLLLNIGPAPDGTIPRQARDLLLAVGKWLDVNGKGIYGTRPWIRFGEGPTRSASGSFSDNAKVAYTSADFRFTTKGDILYAFCLGWPEGEARITSLGTKVLKGVRVEDVSMLGSKENLKWKQDDGALIVSVPSKKPCDVAYAFKIRLSGRGMSDMDIRHDAEDTVQATVRLQNYQDADWSAGVRFIVNRKAVESKTATVKPLAVEELSFVYGQNNQGFYDITATCGSDTLPAARIFMPGIKMAGKWKFHRGDDGGWKNPGFDDKGWQAVEVPSYWEDSSNFIQDNVYGWYRRTLVIPDEWKGRALILPLGAIDDVDETYFNGKKIGGCGTFPPNYQTAYDQQRRYTVHPEDIRYGRPNVIAVKVFDGVGGGGMGKGPMGMVELVAK